MNDLFLANEDDVIFKYALIFLYSVFTIIRSYYGRIVRKEGGEVVSMESDLSSVILRVLIVIETVVFLLFIRNFSPLLWAKLPFPPEVRWIGFGIGVLSLLLFVSVHQVMRSNFSSILLIRENHELIDKGPYKRIRHPMYTAFFLLHFSVFLVSSNWIMGIIWIGGISLVIALRIKREEAMMIKQFGEKYREYQKRSALFLPKI